MSTDSRSWKLILLLLSIGMGIIVLLIYYSVKYNFVLEDFTKDPHSIAELPFYIGILSNLGIVIWCLASGVCLTTYLVIRRSKRNAAKGFFQLSFIFTFLLMLDDFFMIHEEVLPMLTGLNETVLYAFYGLLLLLIVWRYYSFILKETPWILWLISLFLLGSSVLIDSMRHDILEDQIFVEDAFKFLGCIAWFTYFVRSAIIYVRPLIIFEPTLAKEKYEDEGLDLNI